MESLERLLNGLIGAFYIALMLVGGFNYLTSRRRWGDIYYESLHLDKSFSERYLTAETGVLAVTLLYAGFGLFIVLVLAILGI